MEFQAIILAGGRGTRMSELTSHIPKCLLPIGNKPMIYYPVRMLEKAGFSEINIITLNSIKSRVETELRSNCGIKSSLNIVGIDESDENDQDEEDFGTANCLHLLKDKIFKDCIIVSCDLISNVNIQLMSSYFRLNNAAFVMLLSNNLDQSNELPLPGSKGKYSPESDVIGIDLETNRLLYLNTVADVEEIEVKKSIAEKYPKITWTTKLQDAHFYIMKKWLVDYLFDNPKKFESIKSEFVPYIINKQFSSQKKRLKEQLNNYGSPSKKQSNAKQRPKLFDYAKLDELTNLVNKASGNSKQTLDVLGCYGFIQADGFCYRNNNLAIYAESNRQIMGKIMPYYHRERAESLNKHDRTQVGADSIVGDGTTIGDKSTIKRSVIGRNCRIGEKVKINNSILMDDIEVDESTTINFSIISNNCKINAKSEFKDCLIGFKQNVAAGKYSNEKLEEDDSFMDGY